MTAHEKMTRARAALILDHPFFGALSLRLKLIADAQVRTGATNGVDLKYSPSFVDSLTEPQVRGFIAHEVLHCAAGHIWRRDGRDSAQWNIACDRAINHHITAAGLQLPPDVLPGEDRSAEEIYARDYQHQPQQGGKGNQPGQAGQQSSQPDEDPGNCGGVEDAPADAEAQQGTQEDWQVATVQAAQAAKAFGKLPACAERMLDEILRPPVDWRTILADFVQRSARNDYDWCKPNPRHFNRGIILPGLRSNELPDVVVCVDTSGSIDARTMASFAGAISDVLAAYPTRAHVIEIDAQIQGVRLYESADLPIQFAQFRGGGGTDFRPAFEWVAREDIQPACLIYLTDCFGSFPHDAPEYPVLWACTSDQRAPFGETLKIAD